MELLFSKCFSQRFHRENSFFFLTNISLLAAIFFSDSGEGFVEFELRNIFKREAFLVRKFALFSYSEGTSYNFKR